MVIYMKEIKVEKDVVLSDCYYYLSAMLDEIKTIWDNLEFVNRRKRRKRRKENYTNASDLFLAKEILAKYTDDLERHIAIFKENEGYDIDNEIRKYNKECNYVIRVIINKERT